MTGSGSAPYAPTGHRCGECGRPKLGRVFATALTGCGECDEVLTRHRCTKRPDITAVGGGDRWVCPDCASVWVTETVTEPCEGCGGDCGHLVRLRCWDVAEDRRAQGPRRAPTPQSPFHTVLRMPPDVAEIPVAARPPPRKHPPCG
jgi:hypothetical protein